MNKKQSNLLIDEYPLMVLPRLATIIGLNEAIILQQLHFWLRTNPHERDGRKWSYNSFFSWQYQFPFWCISTIKRTIGKLEENGLIITGNYNKIKIDRTKWYTIDYDLLEKLKTDNNQEDKKDTSSGANCTNQESTLTKPIPETIAETTAKTTKDKDKDLSASPKKTDSPDNKFSIKIEYPNLTIAEKAKILKERAGIPKGEPGAIPHNKKMGYFWDILIQNKTNAKEFLEAAGESKNVYALIGKFKKRFGHEFQIGRAHV